MKRTLFFSVQRSKSSRAAGPERAPALPPLELPGRPDVWSKARRRVFLLASPVALFACAAGVLLQLPDINPLDLWMLSLLGGVLGVSATLVLCQRLDVERALAPLYGLAATYFVAMLANQYNLNVGREERLSEATYWFPVLYCLAFLAWDLPRAPIMAGVPFGLSVALTLAYVPIFEDRGQWTVRLASILLQFVLSQGVLIGLLTSFAFLGRRLAQVRVLVYMDFLTTLPNRRFLEEQARELERHPAGSFSVVMFDVDHFKRVNDECGHHVGDQVLRELARLASQLTRAGTWLARWGGEEFVLLLPDGAETGAQVAERLRAAIAAHQFAEVSPVTASFGVAQRRAGESFAATLSRADGALYQAKQQGRDRVVVAAEALTVAGQATS